MTWSAWLRKRGLTRGKVLMKTNEIELDITEEVATYTVAQLIKLLKFLEKNGFQRVYFDGYNASISVFKYQPERLSEKTSKEDAIV